MKAKLCSRILPAIICSLISLPGCGIKSGKDLSVKDKKYLTSLGLLEANEQIILFNSQGTGLQPIKQSGNFFTDKRIASYWIDNGHKSRSQVEFAFYQEIDTMWRYPKYHSLTLASYLEVHRKDGTTFKVFVDADSVNTWNFFNKALSQWRETTDKRWSCFTNFVLHYYKALPVQKDCTVKFYVCIIKKES